MIRTSDGRAPAASVVVVALISGFAASPAIAKRFHGDVAGVATGPGHQFVVGDGLYLRFRDARRSSTDYRVCWSRGHGRRCWQRTAGRKGHISRIFTAAPQHVGTYRVKWRVGGRVVARWSFSNGPGD